MDNYFIIEFNLVKAEKPDSLIQDLNDFLLFALMDIYILLQKSYMYIV